MVCVSPLTSLMMDQQAKYAPKGIKVQFVGEVQSDPGAKDVVLEGRAQLVFISPESLIRKKVYRNMLLSSQYKRDMVALVVDEAHCIKTWGEEFRTAFAEIGDLRSLLPTTVNVMALTATATSETLDVVTRKLSLDNLTLITLAPNQDNISYEVRGSCDIEEFAAGLCSEFFAEEKFPKTVIYVRTYNDCSSIYMQLKKKLGSHFTNPPGYPNLSQFRQIDMFTRVLTVDKKE